MSSSQAQQQQQHHASKAPAGQKQPPPPPQPAANGAAHMQGLFSSGLNLSMSNGDFLSSRLTSYQTAISGEETPVAAPDTQGPWETPYLQGTPVASSQVCPSLLHAYFSTSVPARCTSDPLQALSQHHHRYIHLLSSQMQCRSR